jgi:hypothetical protein
MKRTQGMFAVLVLGSTLAGAAVAHAAPPPGMGAGQLRELRAESWDLKRLENLQDRFARARARSDRAALRAVERELEQFLDAELRESRAEVREAKTDPRRNVRVARAEIREESRTFQRIRAIDRELARLYRRYDRSSLAKKSELISELVRSARFEVADARADVRGPRRR